VLAVACAACPEAPIDAPAGSFTTAQYRVVASGTSATVPGAAVRPEFFSSGGGVLPIIGRRFIPEEYDGRQVEVAMIGHQYWTEVFASRPDAIGTKIEVDGAPRVIVGVMPAAFQPKGDGSIWIPQTAR
jgi:hypothetical protein